MLDEYTRLVTGDYLPAFEMVILEGERLNSGSLKGKSVLMHFFIISCPHCIKSFKMLERIRENLKGEDGLLLISLGRGHSAEELEIFKEGNTLDISLAPDPDRSIYNRFAKSKVPRCYLFSKKGRLLFQVRGADENSYNQMEQLLKEDLAAG